MTAANTGMTLCVALSYGGRQEIMDGVKALAAQVADGTLRPEDISAGHLEGALESADLPSLDLIIRTSGEQRLSNFLLWQAAYAELYFDPVLWPDYFGQTSDNRAAGLCQSRATLRWTAGSDSPLIPTAPAPVQGAR